MSGLEEHCIALWDLFTIGSKSQIDERQDDADDVDDDDDDDDDDDGDDDIEEPPSVQGHPCQTRCSGCRGRSQRR